MHITSPCNRPLHHTSLHNFYIYSRSMALFIKSKKLITTKMVPAQQKLTCNMVKNDLSILLSAAYTFELFCAH